MKQRITVNLDAEVVDALKAMGGPSVSATANELLRRGVAEAEHSRALLEWVEELNTRHGRPSAQATAEAEAALDELLGEGSAGSAAA